MRAPGRVAAVADSTVRPDPQRVLAQASTASARERRALGAGEIILTIVLCLLAGHLAIRTYFASFAINVIGLGLVAVILGRVLFIKKDVFAFVVAIFFLSCFQYANHQGGLFNLVAFLLGSLYLLLQSNGRETGARDPRINALVIILIASDFLGLLVRNPMPPYVIVLQGATFTAYMLMFVIAGHVNLTEARLRKLLIVSATFVVFNFVVSLNNHYGTVLLDTPLLGLTPELFYAAENAFGTFGSASSNGQYAMMMLALLAPLVSATASKSALHVRLLIYVPVLALCGLTIVLANMRAAAVEAVVIVAIYFMMFSTAYRRFFRNSKYLNMASVAAGVFLVFAGVWVGLQNIERDFRAVEIGSVKAVESGEALNRGSAWQVGMQALENGNWWIGYGLGNGKSNLIASGGKWVGTGEMDPLLRPGEIIGGGHFHNLYLQLPTLYGWVGAVVYVLLYLVVVFRLFRAVRRYSLGSLTVVACLGFLMSLAFFLLDEVKSGNAVQTISYGMISWIWLGLGLAAWRTLMSDVAAARRRRPAPERDREAEAAPEEETSAEEGTAPEEESVS
jgi:O-antigen ligase